MGTNYFHPILKVTLRELHRLYHDRTLQFITFVGPGIAFVFLAWIFIYNVPHHLPVGVVDMDHTTVSRQLARMVDATSIAKINRNFTSLDEARKDIENGSIEAIVYIPDGFEKDINHGISAKVAIYINNENVLKGGLLNTGIRKAISTLSAEIKLQVQLSSGLNQNQAMNKIMPVQLREELLFNPYTNYTYYLTAALMPVLLIVFVLLGAIYVIGNELYVGSGPQWIRAGNKNFLFSIIGKLIPYTIIYFCWAMVLNYILFYRLGIPLHGKYILIILGEFLLILSYQSMAIAVVSITSNLRLSLALGTAYSMLGISYSGLTFPVFGMSAFSQVFASIFPNTYWTKLLLSQSLRGEPVNHALIPLLVLLIFIAFGLLFLPLLRYMMLNRKRWGKI